MKWLLLELPRTILGMRKGIISTMTPMSADCNLQGNDEIGEQKLLR